MYKGQQGSQEEARRKVGWEMVHKALGGWSNAGFSSFCKEERKEQTCFEGTDSDAK